MQRNSKLLYLDKDTLQLLQSIKAERKKRGLSQYELAAILNITYVTILNYEKNLHFPTLSMFLKLAEFFEWDISHNVNFLFAKYGQDTQFLRKLKNQYGLPNVKLASLMKINESEIRQLFSGQGSINVFVKFMRVIHDLSREKAGVNHA